MLKWVIFLSFPSFPSSLGFFSFPHIDPAFGRIKTPKAKEHLSIFFKILFTLLYVDQCPRSEGITEVRTPPWLHLKRILISVMPHCWGVTFTQKPPTRGYFTLLFLKNTQELGFLEDVTKFKEQPKFQCWLILDTNMLQQ